MIVLNDVRDANMKCAMKDSDLHVVKGRIGFIVTTHA